jgi:hypothetical protein
MRKTILSLAAAAAVAASALTAAASNAQGTPAAPATQTRAEAIAQADLRFAQMDTDHDGLVGPVEMQAYRAALHDRAIARGDSGSAPGGGRGGMGRGMRAGAASMTKAAFEARAGERFDRMDANHDGIVDAAERANRSEMRNMDHRQHRDDAPAPAQ